MLGNGQPEARTTRRARPVDLIKPLEDTSQVGGGDANSRVLDREDDAVVRLSRDAHGHTAARRRELYRVV